MKLEDSFPNSGINSHYPVVIELSSSVSTYRSQPWFLALYFEAHWLKHPFSPNTLSALSSCLCFCVLAAVFVAFEECRRDRGEVWEAEREGQWNLWLITFSVTEEVQWMDYSNSAWTTTATQHFQGSEGEIRRKRAGKCYPIFFVSLQSAMQKVPRHFLVFVQPLNDKWLKPPVESRKDVCNYKLGAQNYTRRGFFLPYFYFLFWCCKTVMGQVATHAGYSGTLLLKKGRSLQYSLYSHLTLKWRFM